MNYDYWEFFVGLFVGGGGVLGCGWLDAFRHDSDSYRRGYWRGQCDGYEQALTHATEIVQNAVNETTPV